MVIKCKKGFPLNTALGEEMIKTLHQISLLKVLRPQLMSKKGGDELLLIILDFFKVDKGEFVKKNNVKRQPEYKDLILFQVKDGN